MEFSLFAIALAAVVTLFSIVMHEVAHGAVAYYFKDRTAYASGRLTLNPLPHIDIIGSVLVPIGAFLLASTLFGWAKPVPVNPRNLVGKYADFWVSAAGVLANLFLVVVAFTLSYFLAKNGLLTEASGKVLYMILVVNLSLALFNLIPIPPFDGMSILQSLFPKLRIQSTIIYNPFFIIAAIIVASFIYGLISPHVFRFVLGM
jgi:Zn-dependent protease